MFHDLVNDSRRFCYQIGVALAEEFGDELQGGLEDFLIDLLDEEEYFTSQLMYFLWLFLKGEF